MKPECDLVRQDSGCSNGSIGSQGRADTCHYRLVVLGAGGVGKSSLVTRYIAGHFTVFYQPTLEDSYRHVVRLPDGVFQSIEIVDTAGYHQFPAMQQLSIQSGHAFFVVFEIDKKQSFEHAKHLLELILYTKGETSVPMILIGNKLDLACTRQVALEEGQKAAAHYQCGYVETSAKDNVNVQDIFTQILARSFPCDKFETIPSKPAKVRAGFRPRFGSTKNTRLRKNSDESTERDDQRPPSCILL